MAEQKPKQQGHVDRNNYAYWRLRERFADMAKINDVRGMWSEDAFVDLIRRELGRNTRTSPQPLTEGTIKKGGVNGPPTTPRPGPPPAQTPAQKKEKGKTMISTITLEKDELKTLLESVAYGYPLRDACRDAVKWCEADLDGHREWGRMNKEASKQQEEKQETEPTELRTVDGLIMACQHCIGGRAIAVEKTMGVVTNIRIVLCDKCNGTGKVQVRMGELPDII